MTTNVPSPTWGPKGFIVPESSVVLNAVIEDINSAFGGGLNPALDTPQGQLASSEAALIVNTNATFLFLSNQFNPLFASGRYQDALAAIYGLQRNPSQPTVVQAVCSGLAGTDIPVGAIAVAVDGHTYSCTQAGTIPVGGSITLTFACDDVGPIPCPAGTLIQIYQTILGWDSIDNVADGTLGSDVESRAAFETRREETVGANSLGTLPSILGRVLRVPNVIDAYVTENPSNNPETVGGVLLNPNSLFVAVVGGEAADIAEAIWRAKPPGCNYNGNTTVTVLDTSPQYIPPFPAYSVQFTIPDPLPILFAVSITNSVLVPSDAVAQIQNAIVSAFSGGDGGPRATIGAVLYASRFYAPVAVLGTWASIISILVGSNNSPKATFTAAIAGTNMTVSAVASGTLAPGQTISDVSGNLIVGTTIVSQSSGSTGSTGVYVVDTSQTVGSEVMRSAKADLNDVAVHIDQTPTINIADIKVTLV